MLTIHVYTDASVCSKTQLAVIGFWILRPDTFDQVLPICVVPIAHTTTSDDAEMCAAVTALKTVQTFLGAEESISVHLYSDSQAVDMPQARRKSDFSDQLQFLKERLNVTVHKMQGHVAKKNMTSPHQIHFSKVDQKTRFHLRQLRKHGRIVFCD